MTDKRTLLFDSRTILRQLLCFVAGCLRLSLSFTLTDVEELRNTTCYLVYKSTLENNTKLDFTLPIGGLGCPNGSYYHCLPLTDDLQRNIQFCSDWIWIEPGKCPSVYTIQQAIQPYACNRDIQGCPRQLYKSYDYYLYEQCLSDLTDTQQKEEIITAQASKDGEAGTDMMFDTENKDTKEKDTDHPWYAWVIILAIAIAIVLAALGFWVFWRRSKNTDHIDGTNASEGAELQNLKNAGEGEDVQILKSVKTEKDDDNESYHSALDPEQQETNETNDVTSRGILWSIFSYFTNWRNNSNS